MASRLEDYFNDCESLVENCKELTKLKVSNVFLEGETLHLTLDVHCTVHNLFIIGNGDDYPDNTSFSCKTCNDELSIGRRTAQEALKELLRMHDVSLAENGEIEIERRNSCTQNSPGNFKDANSTIEESDEEYSDLVQDSSFALEIGTVLRNEIEEFCCYFGSDTISYSHRPGLDRMDVFLLVGTEELKENVRMAWKLPEDPLVCRLMEIPVLNEGYRKEKAIPRISLTCQDPEAEPSGAQKQLEMIANRFFREKWAELSTGETGGLLYQLGLEVKKRMKDLSTYCMICDLPHKFPMFLPAICMKDLCVFAHTTLGLMEGLGSIALGAEMEVVVLLQTMLKKAAFSGRWCSVLEPFPRIPDPKNPENFMFSVGSNNDIESLRRVLSSLTCAQMLTKALVDVAKENMEQAKEVIKWSISSNRTFLVKLKKESLLGFMQTNHQFLMLTDTPAKQQAFLEAKQKHGSVFLFHGSPIENWHSILRRGLLNASGTKFQLHGTAHGNGIYLSTHLSVSLGYSKKSDNQQAAIERCSASDESHSCSSEGKLIDWRKPISCIAICEVINSQELHNKGDSILTLSNPEHCCTRFLFAFDGSDFSGSAGNVQATTNVVLTDQKFTDQMRSVIDEYMKLTAKAS